MYDYIGCFYSEGYINPEYTFVFNHEDILSQLQNLQNELRGEWEGRAFEGFDQQFNQLKPKVQNFAQLLQEINMQLNKTAEAVASHDEELSRNFGLK